MTIFGYTLGEAQKAIVAFILFAASGVALFVAYDPSFNDALVVLVGNGFAVVAVFAAPKFSEVDFSKAIWQLFGSVQSCIGFWITLDPSVWVKLSTLVGAGLAAFLVWWKGNDEPIEIEPPPPVPAAIE